jgi:hypothetical protein
MLKPLCLAALLASASSAQADAALTPTESRWITAGTPVVRHALAARLPIDIVVQPDDEPDASPIAMGIKDGRCKLVLSLRGNPGAAALDRSVPPGLFDAAAEAVFAHEIGHCWRWVHGIWKALPAGFSTAVDDLVDDAPEGVAFAALAAQRREMNETRREEGYADLVGLAWTRRAHPAQYGAVLEWLERFRDDGPAGAHHDTTAWLRLAGDPSVFSVAGDLFGEAEALWAAGVRAEATGAGER